MCVRYVAYVGEIEEVGIVAELEFGLARFGGFDHGREELDVAFAEDGSRADCAGEEGFCGAVGFEDG